MLSLEELKKKADTIRQTINLLSSSSNPGTFRYGEAPNYDATDISFPLLGMRFVSSNVDGKVLRDNYNFYFADLVHKDQDNLVNVQSDMKRAALRFYSELRASIISDTSGTLGLSAPITPFEERWGDECAGVEINIVFEQFFDRSTCD